MKGDANLIRRLAVVCSFAVQLAFAADCWYVADNGGSDGNDGRSAATPVKTIQAAVDRAASGDTVKVAPGVYTGANVYDATSVACVIITNDLTLVATGPKESTHIVGRHADTSSGIGEGAVRCVYVKDGTEARIEGFTLRDGAVASTISTGNLNFGGGVRFSSISDAAGWLVDCVVSNCVAYRGGAMQNGTAIRCRFSGNRAESYGQVASQSILYNCLIVRNNASNRLFNHPRAIVNCTIADNTMDFFCYVESEHAICNTIFLENSNHRFYNNQAVLSNCLVSSSIANFDQTASGHCATNDTGACFTAPALGDWRPRSDSGAAGLGDAAHLSLVALPDESLRYVDYAGKPIPRSGPITCGAIQEAVTVDSGTLVLDGAFELDGFGVADSARCNYLHATNYPCMYAMKAVGATISNIVWYSSTTGIPIRVPTLDGRVGVMPPPTGTMTLAPVRPAKVVYADAVNGDDGYAGSDIGSWDHPYKTLQAAVNATPDDQGSTLRYAVVCAKPGRYCEGGEVVANVRRRVSISGSSRRLRVVALEGPERTFICGEPADGNDVPCACAYMYVVSVVQGFTLTGGVGTSDVASVLHCALNTENRIIADCIVSNNVSAFGAQRGGLSLRCVFSDNRESNSGSGDVRGGCAVQGVYRLGPDSNSSAYTFAHGSKAIFSTYSGAVNDNAVLVNSLAASSACRFFDLDAGDYRLLSDSPAFGAGVAAPENYWRYANLDIDGKPLALLNAWPTSGAHQWPSATVMAVDAVADSVTVDGGSSYTNALLPGASVTVAKAADCHRNLLGFDLPDGTFVEAQSCTYTAPEASGPGQVDVVSAVFSTNWYVNAGSLGDDAHDGFTAATPKKTLAGVMAETLSGDTVHAAPGEYADGEMFNTEESGAAGGNPVIGSRVVIPRGVTLVSDEGADSTHIVGASASAEYDVQLGLGSNAVRCAFVSTGARLKGFTLRDGRTNAMAFSEDGSSGAGVLGVSGSDSFVEDCVISNCIAVYGGAGYAANFKRCRFFHNRAIERSSVTRVSAHDSCVADWNWGARPFDYFVIMTNCTIGAHQIDENGVVGNGYSLMQPGDANQVRVIDCLVLGRIHSQVKMRRTAALATSGVNSANCEDCILTNLAALAVDANYRPIIGENVAIDVLPLASEDESVRSATDAYGEQRVFNGARDLGALDADWRPRYAKRLGALGISVTAADPAVVETADAVRIPAGALELAWRTPEGRLIPHAMELSVVGGGTLAVEKDGVPLTDVTVATSGVRTFDAAGTVHLRFAHVADGGSEEYAELRGLWATVGFQLHFR